MRVRILISMIALLATAIQTALTLGVAYGFGEQTPLARAVFVETSAVDDRA